MLFLNSHIYRCERLTKNYHQKFILVKLNFMKKTYEMPITYIKSLDKYRKGKSNVDIGVWVS